MQKHWLMALLALAVSVACESAPETDTIATETIATDVARSDIVYVDVRSDEEWAAGHVEGAIHIPHTEIAERIGELEGYGDKELYLYCRSGRRSGIALRVLEEAGFDNATNAGGLNDLVEQGVPTTQ